MKTINLVIPSFCLVLAAGFIQFGDSSKVIGCYYGSWAGYRNGAGRFEPENIDASLCTHLYYTFVGITPNGNIKHLDEWNDLPSGKDYFARFNALRAQNPNAKTLVAIGGWNEGSSIYSQVANNDKLRAVFAKSAADFVQLYNFDGFDLDWEYPADRGGAPSDYDAFILLLKEMRSVFDDRGGLLLTAAVGVNVNYVYTSYNVKEMSKYLDLINMMAYDVHGAWESTAGHHAPMYKSKVDVSEAALALNVNASIYNWLSHGALAEKLVLGVATYGRSFTLTNPSNTAIGAPISGPGTPGPYTQESGSLGFNEICQKVNDGWTVEWDSDILAPYAFNGNQWVGFDNIRSAKIKAQYAKDLGLAGVFVWSLETDDFLGSCGHGKYPILNTLNEVINDGASGGGGSGGLSSNSTTSSAVITESTTSSSTTSTAASSGGVCSSEGYMADPTNCQVFYHCQSDGQNGFIANKFLCSGNLVFDPQIKICNYPYHVPSCN